MRRKHASFRSGRQEVRHFLQILPVSHFQIALFYADTLLMAFHLL
jgi:hypothetical protein